MTPSLDALFAAIDATWPAVRSIRAGAWWVREGGGGGSRVSSATTEDEEADLGSMEAAQAALGQPALVRLRGDQARLDARLAAAGYAVKDPTNIRVAPVARLAAGELPRVRVFAVDFPPLVIQREMWAEGGIGPERLAIMERAEGPKTALLGRSNDTPAGTAFVAVQDDIAMLHALEVREAMRRQGAAVNMMRGAARWAQDHGARYMTVLVTQQNVAANALYERLEMDLVGHYLYRRRQARQEAG
ncbi:GNAT family N-acetyltransferase [Vannielia litorea]|uniref:Acetyltransferase (GNAT) family protein n=1 Tax=Vannielia litorea TaxID=1217970 RepID=A0A1N6H1S5_9RHOB|nr:GNAT family N-acetyltransferase [Vannielia litorea]SIO13753.1 Acetyltransferase (GNAT) family protein [Vannielia litorea]